MHVVGPPGMGWQFVLLTIKTYPDPNRRRFMPGMPGLLRPFP